MLLCSVQYMAITSSTTAVPEPGGREWVERLLTKHRSIGRVMKTTASETTVRVMQAESGSTTALSQDT